jgi:[acyl-carrier-protein] S-malonyltransferase
MNSVEQIVIAGHLKAVDEVSLLAKKSGAKKVVTLPVSAPFHSPLMKPAEIKLQKELGKIIFKDHQFPVISNVDVRPITMASFVSEALVRQVCSPVRWSETISKLANDGNLQ